MDAKQRRKKLTQIIGTTEEDAKRIVAKAVEDAVAANLDERATAALIQERITSASTHISKLRSRIIARTETHNASQASGYNSAKASGFEMRKEWSASLGDRTRDAHIEANGQRVGIDEPFIVDGEELMYCGDLNGSAANIINCRCVTLFVLA